MSQRSSLIVFCFASALVGGIVATQSAGRDRATAQVANLSADAASALWPCRQCVWDYRNVQLPGGVEVELLPPGTTGVLHGVYPGGNIELFDGGMATGTKIGDFISYGTSIATVLNELDIHFSNGLTARYSSSGFGRTMILYRLDSPLSTGPEK